jgi:hypothetical protein
MPLIFLDGMEDGSSYTGSNGQRVAARNGLGYEFRDNGDYFFYDNISSGQATLTVGFAYRPIDFVAPGRTSNTLLTFRGPNPTYGMNDQTVLYVAPDGSFYVRRGSSGVNFATTPPILNIGAWHYVEVQTKVHLTQGTFKLRVNNVQYLNLSNINTTFDSISPSTTLTSVRFGTGSNSSRSMYDDLYVCAGDDDPFLGDLVVETIYPSGNGDVSEWRGSDGNTTDNYLLVDENPINGSDYVRTSTHGLRDLYQMQNLSLLAGTVLGVQHNIWAGSDDLPAEPCGISILNKGTTELKSTLRTITTGGDDFRWCLPINPDTGAAWTIAEVNALQSGVQYVDPGSV